MKLSLTHYDETVTIERERDDVNIEEVMDMVEALLVAASYDARLV